MDKIPIPSYVKKQAIKSVKKSAKEPKKRNKVVKKITKKEINKQKIMNPQNKISEIKNNKNNPKSNFNNKLDLTNNLKSKYKPINNHNNKFIYKMLAVFIILGILGITAFIATEKPSSLILTNGGSRERGAKKIISESNGGNIIKQNIIGQAFNFEYGNGETTIQIPIKLGLNLISIPLNIQDDISNIFPDSLKVYIYDNKIQSWKSTTKINGGEVYFIVYPKDEVISVSGAPILSYQTDVSEGWNAISSVNDVQTFNYESPLIENTLITYNPKTSSYESVKEIEPGKGYFVLCNQEGTVNINGLTNSESTTEEIHNALKLYGSRPPSP